MAIHSWLVAGATIALSVTVQALAEEQATSGNQPAAAAQAAPQGPTVPTVWKAQEVDFLYRSSVAVFSCDALRRRVAIILQAIGARDDIQVRADDCNNGLMPADMSPNMGTRADPTKTMTDPMDPWRSTPSVRLGNRPANLEQLTRVRIRLMWPTQVTPKIIEELQRDQSRRELISRVTRNPAAKNDHPVLFQAQRQTVTLSHRSIGLDPVECELLDQLSTGVFRELGVKVVSRNMSCDRGSISRIPPQMTVESLMPVLVGATELPHIAEEDEAKPGETAAAEVPPAGDAPPPQ
ncbi:hypothetical protein [Povalibacter sp.]|uniref:hypothetical protein n=1 Tax=Povalibacter sp. TaxID=1962978 RepID=UPI002F4242B1